MSSYDSWKSANGGYQDGGGGCGIEDFDRTTRRLWWQTYHFVERTGDLERWLETQRGIPLFAAFVREADRSRAGEDKDAA